MKDELATIITDWNNPEKKSIAFNRLVEATQERLYWHIRKMVLNHEDANDVLQNTYIKAWKGLDNFKGQSKLYTWLYRIATNETLTFLTSRRMKNITSSIEYEEELLNNMTADSYFDGDEIQIKLQEAILSLPEKQRIVFNMKYFENTKYSDMSEILGTSEGALKASYHHAVKKIEAFFKNRD